MKIIDPYSGKRKFFKGHGRTGTKKLDEFQKMLLKQEQINLKEDMGFIVQNRQSVIKKRQRKLKNKSLR